MESFEIVAGGGIDDFVTVRHLRASGTNREIGERLFVSRHTVKTQAMSIYRKLGVSSRAEAVDAARGIGLLGS